MFFVSILSFMLTIHFSVVTLAAGKKLVTF